MPGYHPQTNGQCECFNATLINMFGTLPEKPKITCREHVPTLVLHTIVQRVMQLISVCITSCLAETPFTN